MTPIRYLHYEVYCSSQAGLSNTLMSIEIGAILAGLMDRVLVLAGNGTPSGNRVEYPGRVSNRYCSRVTDLIELPVPWIGAEQARLRTADAPEFGTGSLAESVFVDRGVDISSPDFRAFARGRQHFLSFSDELQRAAPVLCMSGGPGNHFNLSFYSYFLYLQPAGRRTVRQLLQALQPKPHFAAFAARVANALGPFNAVHVRRGDFKLNYGVTTLDRRPAEAIEAMDQHFKRDDLLLILTDERDDPFFREIRHTYPHSRFVDEVILEEFGGELAELPYHDSVAIAFLSQLVAAEAGDFIGSFTSTFTALIQRWRGLRGKDERFKFLWNELPDVGELIERGRHRFSECVPMAGGLMVEQFAGPYSWNRVNQRINPAWMREWPEVFALSATGPAGVEHALAEPAAQGSQDAVVHGVEDWGSVWIAFGNDQVEVCSPCDEVTAATALRFRRMVATRPGKRVGLIAVYRNGSAGYRVEADRAESVIGTAEDAMVIICGAIARAFMRARPDLVWLHAGAVQFDGRALMLVGPWGHGKSTISTGLLKHGARYLSDDLAPFDPVRLLIHPFPRAARLRINPGVRLDRAALRRVSKADVVIGDHEFAPGPVPCAGVIFPRFEFDAPDRLDPCAPTAAVLQVLQSCLSFAQHREVALRFASSLAQAVPTFQLSFRDAGVATELIARQFAQVASSA